MEKKLIETFIKKYHLSGLIEEVLWKNTNNLLSVNVMSSDKKLFTSVQSLKIEPFFTGVEIGVLDTTKLKRMLSPLSENIQLSVDIDENDNTRVRQLIANDHNMTVTYVTANKGVIDPSPNIKSLPPFTLELNLTPEFIEIFSKSFSSLGDGDALFTLMLSKTQKIEMVLGYKENQSDRIAIQMDALPGKDTITNPISFNAKYLKEILAANSVSEKSILRVSESGISSISFDNEDFKSQYYLIKVDVEN
jgi:hypothetical protein